MNSPDSAWKRRQLEIRLATTVYDNVLYGEYNKSRQILLLSPVVLTSQDLIDY